MRTVYMQPDPSRPQPEGAHDDPANRKPPPPQE